MNKTGKIKLLLEKDYLETPPKVLRMTEVLWILKIPQAIIDWTMLMTLWLWLDCKKRVSIFHSVKIYKLFYSHSSSVEKTNLENISCNQFTWLFSKNWFHGIFSKKSWYRFRNFTSTDLSQKFRQINSLVISLAKPTLLGLLKNFFQQIRKIELLISYLISSFL